MSKDTKIENATTPELGSEVVANDFAHTNSPEVLGNTTDYAGEVPEWVDELLDSNQAVVDSNQEVLDSNNAVIEALKSTKAVKSDPYISSLAPKSKVKTKAKYAVCVGKKFVDAHNPSVTYKAGHDVSSFEKHRLQNLLDQGIIEEVD